MAFIVMLSGENEPVPEDDHVAPDEMLYEPASETLALFAQTVWLDPGFTTGPGSMETVRTLDIGLQPPLLAEVSVSVTSPLVASAWLGMYDVLSEAAEGENTPLPLLVQMPALVVEMPLSTTGTFEQTV